MGFHGLGGSGGNSTVGFNDVGFGYTGGGTHLHGRPFCDSRCLNSLSGCVALCCHGQHLDYLDDAGKGVIQLQHSVYHSRHLLPCIAVAFQCVCDAFNAVSHAFQARPAFLHRVHRLHALFAPLLIYLDQFFDVLALRTCHGVLGVVQHHLQVTDLLRQSVEAHAANLHTILATAQSIRRIGIAQLFLQVSSSQHSGTLAL